MKVAEFQKYLRALADAIGSAKGPAKELEEAAAALAPFADYKMEAFAKFLQLAEAKYGETGELPEGKQPKGQGRTRSPKAEKPTAGQFKARVDELKLSLDRGEGLSRDAVAAEVARFEPLSQKDIESVMADLGFPSRVKPKAKALDAIVTHILAARTASDRVKV
jgi:hypothetical protein